MNIYIIEIERIIGVNFFLKSGRILNNFIYQFFTVQNLRISNEISRTINNVIKGSNLLILSV